MSAPLRAEAARPYFARPCVRRVVLGSFFALTLPLTLLYLVLGPQRFLPWQPLYGVSLGLTHFLITGAMYLDARNLRYFASSPRNRVIYFGVPLAILLGMDGVAASGLRASVPVLDSGLFVFVMAANFLHVSRQSFGVLQLFKRESPLGHPEVLRSLENLFFVSLAVLQLESLLFGGRWAGDQLGVQLTSALCAGLFLAVAGLHLATLRQRTLPQGAQAPPPRGRRLAPLLYFTLQALSGALAVARSELYTIALAMHYVEYHVIMLPRVFHAPVDLRSRADRLRAWLTRSRSLFYALLLGAAWGVWFVQRSALHADPSSQPLAARVALHALDGIFLVHFFVEAFVWRFSKPHYRETLGPLYFAPAAASGPPPRAGAPG